MTERRVEPMVEASLVIVIASTDFWSEPQN
jgi:hypothetical protein